MTVAIASAGFVISFLCALVMGYAIQRGATCTVAAVSQLVDQRRWGRFVGMMEAALWVAGALLLARLFGWIPDIPAGHAVTASTLLGGVLLGIGAYINQACVFGTIAKIGSRDWAYLATPVGFLAGAWLAHQFGGAAAESGHAPQSLLAAIPSLSILLLLPFAAWRIWRTLSAREGTLAERIWAPHEATVVIGIAFAIMFIAAGPWAYTELLAELAVGMPGDMLTRLLLLAALLGGSIIGGKMSGTAGPSRVHLGNFARKFAGGAAMGAGSLLIPGSNDGLILVGMPLLYPYAWVGIGMMCLTVAAALFTERLWARRADERRAAR